MRDFNKWILTLKQTIADWKYYTDFAKVYSKAAIYQKELEKINKLIGSKNIKEEFRHLIEQDKNVMKAIPIILANRNEKIVVLDEGKEIEFDFNKLDMSIDEGMKLVEFSGILDLLKNHLFNNIFDYVVGIEVGMDTNARKNRTGKTMEQIVEDYLKKIGFIKNKTMWPQMKASEIKNKFGIDLTKVDNVEKAEKVFDFVLQKKNNIYAIECNFYGSGGSKLNETARSYENIALQTKNIKNFKFIWITDGQGWLTAKNNLKETFDVLPTLFNLNDLQNGELVKTLK